MRYIIDGCYGDGNIGDEALLRAAIKLIGENDPNPEFRVLSGKPQQTRLIHGTEAIQRNNPFGRGIYGAIIKKQFLELFRALAWCECFVLGGGELFRDDVGLHSTIGMFYPLLLAKEMHKRVIAVGVGMQRPCSAPGRWILRRALMAADAVIFRDSESVVVADQVARRAEFYSWTPDIVFSLPTKPADRSFKAFVGHGGEPLRVALAVKGLPSSQFARDDYLRVFTSITEALLSFSRTFRLAISLLAFGDGDVEVNRELGNILRDRGFEVELELSRDIERVHLALSHAHLAIAMPLHASIFAIAEGIPVIGLAYDLKVTRLYSQFGIDDYCLSCKSITGAELSAKLGTLLQSGEGLRSQLSNRVALAKTRIRSAVQHAFIFGDPIK